VAALERGSTGNKQVQAMVTARMTRTVKIEGGMSREMVKRVIDQHLEEITYCYETALMSNPTILGRIVFEWKILMDGRVGEVRIVASSVNSNTIHGCIKSAIKSWQFPKPVGAEVVVSYPFVFDLVAF
jgi:outer membrane biosynthesis protein TonB